MKLQEARDRKSVTLREPLEPGVLQRIQQRALNDIHPPRNVKLAIRVTLRS